MPVSPRQTPHANRSAAELVLSTFRAHASELQRFLLRRVGNRHDADDLSQEVFARLLRVENAELVRNPPAYVLGIAAHVLREFRQRRRQQCVVFDSEVAELVAERSEAQPGANASTPSDQIDMRNWLDNALQQLPTNHRLVLLLVKCNGLSYEETAKVLGLSINTIERYLVEARARLRAILREPSTDATCVT